MFQIINHGVMRDEGGNSFLVLAVRMSSTRVNQEEIRQIWPQIRRLASVSFPGRKPWKIAIVCDGGSLAVIGGHQLTPAGRKSSRAP